MEDATSSIKKKGGAGMQTPLSGMEQINKISSNTGEGPIQTPLDQGHADKQRGGSGSRED